VPLPDYRALRRDLKGSTSAWSAISTRRTPGDRRQKAMDKAVDAGLGAVVEDVRLSPLLRYYDVKIIIAETELLSTTGFRQAASKPAATSGAASCPPWLPRSTT
jgi:hypothetical protein